MRQRFLPLFTVSVEHSYYLGNGQDFDFVVPSAAARALARPGDGRLHVLFEADDSGLPVSSLAGQTLTLGLRLTNSWFSNYTNPVIDDPRRIPSYSNLLLPAELAAPTGVLLTSGIHAHVPQTATRPLTLQLSDPSDAVLASQTLGPGVATVCGAAMSCSDR